MSVERKRLWVGIAVAAGILLITCGASIVLVRRSLATIAEQAEDRRTAAARQLATQAAVIAAAESFLTAVDERRDDDAWAMTSAIHRRTASREDFVASVEKVHSTYGRARTRRFDNESSRINSVAPDEISSIIFDAAFEMGGASVGVGVVQEKDGWRIVTWDVGPRGTRPAEEAK